MDATAKARDAPECAAALHCRPMKGAVTGIGSWVVVGALYAGFAALLGVTLFSVILASLTAFLPSLLLLQPLAMASDRLPERWRLPAILVVYGVLFLAATAALALWLPDAGVMHTDPDEVRDELPYGCPDSLR